MGDFNFTNNVTGGNAQINQGQNVTATQNNSGGSVWQPALDEAQTEEQTQAVVDIQEIVETYPDAEMLPPEAETRLSAALGFLRDNGPSILRVAGTVALGFSGPFAPVIQAALDELPA